MSITTGCGKGEVYRLHTDRHGEVWYGRNDIPVVGSDMVPDDFVDRMALSLSGAKAIRIVGHKQNARLILCMHRLRQVKDQSSGLLLVAPDSFVIDNPADVLYRLWQPDFSDRMSGSCHVMAPGEFTSYLLAQTIMDADGKVDDKARRILRHHPAWPALSFVASLDEDAACFLVAEIMDPRFYRHPIHPGRLSRLYAYLGLTPLIVTAYLSRSAEYFRCGQRMCMVADCWFRNSQNSVSLISSAGNFLLRIVKASRSPEMGMLRACEALVRFVVEVWQAGLSSQYEFVPEMFFKHEEAPAFDRHLKKLSHA